MNPPKISVIVPVYNVEKYLNRCIDSILAQTFTDFEVLLIDDGSTDRSGKICDEYAEKDNRVRVFHKKNGGVASARQVGIDNAMGKYSIHADGDDWVETTMLEQMYTMIEEKKADMLIADFYINYIKKEVYKTQRTNSVDSLDILKDILTGKLFGSLWHKIIRHSLYKKYNIRFLPDVNYCEDVLALVQLLQHDIKVIFLKEAFYHYNHENTNSITRHYTEQTYLNRKNFVSILAGMVPTSFNYILNIVAFEVKIEAFSHGYLTKKDFYTFYPTPLSLILERTYGHKLKLCMILIYLGFFHFANQLWYSMKNKL